MFGKKAYFCGLVYGFSYNHLDHIAPLCALINIPLIVTEVEMENLAKEFYPDLTVFYFSYDTACAEIVKRFDIVLTCFPKNLFDSFFFLQEKLLKKKLFTIWCPHGNSDKGHEIYFAEALKNESTVLVYGDQMLTFFEEKKALNPFCKTFYVGNYRLDYFLKNQSFYKRKIDFLFSKKLKKNNKTYLYGPTWEDQEGFSSQKIFLSSLLENIPDSINLVVKLHPNTFLSDDLSYERLYWKYETQENILFLKDFPSIYSILDKVDVYLGDSSSIGYDMLYFDKPMFFLNVKGQNHELPLFECGHVFYENERKVVYSKINMLINDDSIFSSTRAKFYQDTFKSGINLDHLKNEIEKFWKEN